MATIQDELGSRFRITGLESPQMANDLALLLRAGALAAPMDIIEERTIGPSLGKENIDRGFRATAFGFLAIAVFMIFYYRVFGLISRITSYNVCYTKLLRDPQPVTGRRNAARGVAVTASAVRCR